MNLLDRNGKNPIVFGLISAGLDAGAQIGINMLKGDSFKDAVKIIDLTSVGSSFLLGMNPENMALKIVSYASVVVDAAVDYSTSGETKYVGSANGENKKAIEMAFIDLLSVGGGEVLGKSLSHSVEKGLSEEASSTATAMLTKQMKNKKQTLAKVASSSEAKFVEGQVTSFVTLGMGQIIKE